MSTIKIKLIVAEPWDFMSSDGDNLLFGEVQLENCGVGKYGEWYLASCTPFQKNEMTVTSLLIASRQHQTNYLANLSSGKSPDVNAYWHKTGEIWTMALAWKAEEKPSEVLGGFLRANIRENN